MLLIRRTDGSVAAITDRCPHRFAPLGLGTLHGDVVEWKYHGLRFAGSGICMFNPHGIINPNMHVRHYPTVERHDLIWMGSANAASADSVPALSYMEAPGGARAVHVRCRFLQSIPSSM